MSNKVLTQTITNPNICNSSHVYIISDRAYARPVTQYELPGVLKVSKRFFCDRVSAARHLQAIREIVPETEESHTSIMDALRVYKVNIKTMNSIMK